MIVPGTFGVLVRYSKGFYYGGRFIFTVPTSSSYKILGSFSYLGEGAIDPLID